MTSLNIKLTDNACRDFLLFCVQYDIPVYRRAVQGRIAVSNKTLHAHNAFLLHISETGEKRGY